MPNEIPLSFQEFFQTSHIVATSCLHRHLLHLVRCRVMPWHLVMQPPFRCLVKPLYFQGRVMPWHLVMQLPFRWHP